jgi:hypothetical protein
MTLLPPYTNRFGTKPGVNYVQCKAVTEKGNTCRMCAQKGLDFCATHQNKGELK